MRDIEEVLELFPSLALAAGLPAQGWDMNVLSRRQDAMMDRVVLSVDQPGYGPMILKAVFAPVDPDAFAAALEAQSAAARCVGGVPAVLASDTAAQVALMERAPGQTLFDLCVDHPIEDHARSLRAAGRWLADFHRAAGTEPRNFRPDFTLGYVTEMAQAVSRGDRQIPQKPLFLSAVEWLNTNAPVGAQCRTVAAQSHGDLNMRNLLVDGDRVSALDFQPARFVPVGHDIVRLALHYGAFCPTDHDSGEVMPGIDLDPFFEGYDLTGPWDHTLPFLARVRLLDDWTRIPKRQEDRSFAQQRRWRGIVKLAKAAFE